MALPAIVVIGAELIGIASTMYNVYSADRKEYLENVFDMSSAIYYKIANYLIHHNVQLNDSSIETISNWIDNNQDKWNNKSSSSNYNILFDQHQSNVSALDFNVYREKKPSYFMSLGYVNLPQFYSFCAFTCAWIYKLTGNNDAKNLSGTFLSLVNTPPESDEIEYWVKPSFTDPQLLKNYSDGLANLTNHYYNLMKPLLNQKPQIKSWFNSIYQESKSVDKTIEEINDIKERINEGEHPDEIIEDKKNKDTFKNLAKISIIASILIGGIIYIRD